ncbi:MAG TPA: putative peptide modification system cyclase [Gammaproteobacteria bacterium]|nr:putative peptide modification system cyclase [Gammaproteobacteria bacterium]
MNAVALPAQSTRGDASAPQLRTILLTDLCDSTQLVERLGDGTAADLFRQHDLLVLQLQQQWRGRLIDRSDGMLLLFERPIDGLGFALDYHRGLRELGRGHNIDLKARAGLHVGEVLTWRNSEEAVKVGAKPLEVEGLAKPMAARLMTMARPGQVLVSAVAEPLAHRSARELGERGQQLLWKSHGRWRFKGVPNSQEIFEVGEAGLAPLRAPKATPKAWRDIPLWRRPAALAAEFAIVLGIGLGIWFVTRPQPAIAFNERDWVVVADLRNLTGQPVLDDSLEQAFRISLEQSRYVNVLSDLKARQTLERMRLPPDTELTRAVASEIAIRDGARAVILPTVAEVGGHVRVSAEVIDPHSQTTVYSEYADGRGAESALASIDSVTASLRAQLGEALERIDKDSEPLPRVTTGNLDALRAYALGVDAYGRRKFGEALVYFEKATDIDPNFALAHLAIARVYVSNADRDRALVHLRTAEALKDRLTERDALYLDAWSAELGPQSAVNAPPKWKLLSKMYPDFHAGHYQYAWSAFLRNDFAEAIENAKLASVPQEPLRSAAFELVARAQLALGRSDEALSNFQRAERLGDYGPNRRRAAALAAMGRFPEAREVLSQLPEQGLSTGNITNQFERISVPLDQGKWEEALAVAKQSTSMAEDASALMVNEFGLIELSVEAISGRTEGSTVALRALAERSLERAADPEKRDRAQHVYFALAAAYLDQRQGNFDLAKDVIAQADPLVREVAEPMSRQLLEVVKAGQLRLTGNPNAAVHALRRQVDGHELFQVHVALRDALEAAGNYEDALLQDEWLAEHRGLAYIEGAGDQALQALNVADTRLAVLNAAKLLTQLGRPEEAKQYLDRFLSAWPLNNLPAHLRRKVAAIWPDSKANTIV